MTWAGVVLVMEVEVGLTAVGGNPFPRQTHQEFGKNFPQRLDTHYPGLCGQWRRLILGEM